MISCTVMEDIPPSTSRIARRGKRGSFLGFQRGSGQGARQSRLVWKPAKRVRHSPKEDEEIPEISLDDMV